MTTNPRARREHGAVTAEAAVVLPVLVLFTVTMAWLVCVGLTQLRALDAAREVARAAARSESTDGAVGLGRRVAPDGSRVSVRREQDAVVATVVSPVRAPGGLLGHLGVAHVTGVRGLGPGARAVNRSDRGLASVLGIALMGLLLCLTLGILCGVAVVGAHRAAQSAADLAALAGAGSVQDGGDACARAAAIAARNHAQLQRCEVEGWSVSVVVVATTRLPIGRVQLPARARAGPVQASARSSSPFSRSSFL